MINWILANEDKTKDVIEEEFKLDLEQNVSKIFLYTQRSLLLNLKNSNYVQKGIGYLANEKDQPIYYLSLEC